MYYRPVATDFGWIRTLPWRGSASNNRIKVSFQRFRRHSPLVISVYFIAIGYYCLYFIGRFLHSLYISTITTKYWLRLLHVQSDYCTCCHELHRRAQHYYKTLRYYNRKTEIAICMSLKDYRSFYFVKPHVGLLKFLWNLSFKGKLQSFPVAWIFCGSNISLVVKWNQVFFVKDDRATF